MASLEGILGLLQGRWRCFLWEGQVELGTRVECMMGRCNDIL